MHGCRWVEDFSSLQLGGQPHEQWAQDFQQQQQNGRSQSWGQIWDEGKQTNEWATDFEQSQSATVSFCSARPLLFSRTSE